MVSTKQASAIVAHKLNVELDRGKVLLVLSGGSASKLAAGLLHGLSNKQKQNLFVVLGDERYGPRNHPDSNWLALQKSGFNLNDIPHYIILWEKQINLEATAMEFESRLKRQLHSKPLVVALFGIGTDGHTAGIIPGSSAVSEHNHLVAEFKDDRYERITIAPPFFDHIDQAYIYAEGPEKASVVSRLDNETNEQLFPAALVKRAKHYMVLYNEDTI